MPGNVTNWGIAQARNLIQFHPVPAEISGPQRPPSSISPDLARDRFLRLVDLAVPNVLGDLRRQVLPLYRRIHAAAREVVTGSNGSASQSWVAASVAGASVDPQQAFLDGLANWADRYHLNVDWVRARAIATLQEWCVRGTTAGAGWQAISNSGEAISGRVSPFEFVADGWNPHAQSRPSYEEGLLRDFAAQLQEYLERVERHRASRVEPGPRWRRREAPGDRRLVWLVGWQVQQQSLSRIARAARVDVRLVRAGLFAAAREIQLPLRRTALASHRKEASG